MYLAKNGDFSLVYVVKLKRAYLISAPESVGFRRLPA